MTAPYAEAPVRVDPAAYAQALIDAGVPVVVCRPNPYYGKTDPRTRRLGPELLTPPGWALITAADCDLSRYRPGVDVLAMVGGHGVDVVDVDSKDGGTVDNLPPFRHFGRHQTPSGGWHYFVRSTGVGKLSPLATGAGHVGDYVGGTPGGGSRLLAYLPGSTRPKYPGREYRVIEPIRLDELLEHEPDEDLLAALLACGGSREGDPGKPAVQRAEVAAFLAEHSAPGQVCAYGRNALAGMLASADAVVPGDTRKGRHGWAVSSAVRAAELARGGCLSAADLETLENRLHAIKPEEDWHAVLAWGIANAGKTTTCGLHNPAARNSASQGLSLAGRPELPTGEPGSESRAEPASGGRPPGVAATLVDLAESRYGFGCTEDGEPFAVPTAAGSSRGHVVRMLTGGQVSLRTELAAAYRATTGKVAGQQALADAQLVLAGIAQETDPEPVALRVAEDHAGAVWLDLGDKAERVVRLTAGGWEVRDSAPVRFRRTKLTGALPEPAPGGNLAELWELVNVAVEDRPLVLAWLVAALARPGIPHPVLALLGEQGTGKTTASRLLVSLVDPSPVPLRKPPKDPESWVTAAAGSWVVGLDNLSTVPAWFSDSLCRAVTGDGDVRRQLYTDGGLAVFAFRRAVLTNGIDLGALRGDLADRTIACQLDVIPESRRRTEAELADRWAEAYPRILGALLTECAACLAMLPSVCPAGTPRMADFAHVLAALDSRRGSDGLTRYTGQAMALAEDAVGAEPFLAALRERIAEPFTGTAAELLAEITPDDPTWRPPRDWPRARGVTTLLKRNAPALRKLGWKVAQVTSRDGSSTLKAVQWSVTPPSGRSSPVARPVRVAGPVARPTRTTHHDAHHDAEGLTSEDADFARRARLSPTFSLSVFGEEPNHCTRSPHTEIAGKPRARRADAQSDLDETASLAGAERSAGAGPEPLPLRITALRADPTPAPVATGGVLRCPACGAEWDERLGPDWHDSRCAVSA